MDFIKKHWIPLAIVGGLALIYWLYEKYTSNQTAAVASSDPTSDPAYLAALAAAQQSGLGYPTGTAAGSSAGQQSSGTGLINVLSTPGTSSSGVPSSQAAAVTDSTAAAAGQPTIQGIPAASGTAAIPIGTQGRGTAGGPIGYTNPNALFQPLGTVNGCTIVDPAKGICELNGQTMDCGYIRECDALTSIQHCQYNIGEAPQPGLPFCQGAQSSLPTSSNPLVGTFANPLTSAPATGGSNGSGMSRGPLPKAPASTTTNVPTGRAANLPPAPARTAPAPAPVFGGPAQYSGPPLGLTVSGGRVANTTPSIPGSAATLKTPLKAIGPGQGSATPALSGAARVSGVRTLTTV